MMNIFNSKIWGTTVTQNDKDHLCESHTVREYCLTWPINYADEFGNLVSIAITYCSKDQKEAIKKFAAWKQEMNSSENRSVVLSGMIDLSNLKPKAKSSRHVMCFYYELT